MQTLEQIRQSINKTYRDKLWSPFINAIKTYNLIEPGDKIAVCISGGKDSMLMAVLFKMLLMYSDFEFDLVFLTMDPGYSKENRDILHLNSVLLDIKLEVFETNIFDIVDKQEKNPCYLCAKMRRGHLYKKAQEFGCNKIALGHHFSDVIETTVMSMFYSSQLQAMPPMLDSKNFEGMKLIRPMYCIHEEDIEKWVKYNKLSFMQCACKLTREDKNISSKREETKEIIRNLKKNNSNIEKSIFNAIHNVNIDTFPGYKQNGTYYGYIKGAK